jgi:prepilin-type N-terminal cleavage/methylation domain-containing protein
MPINYFTMEQQKILRNQEGFTLVEIIAVMIILGLLASVAVPRYVDVEQSAKQRVIDAAISELNGQESLVWSKLKISVTGFKNDAQLMPAMDYNLGTDYTWNPGHPVAVGGTLTFKGESVALNRTQSDVSKPALWSR